jgi:WD40 repeat protein
MDIPKGLPISNHMKVRSGNEYDKEYIMSKKRLIVSDILVILIAIVFFSVLAAIITGFATRGAHSIVSTGTSTPANTAISTRPGLMTPTREPTSPVLTPTKTTGQLEPTPICFAPKEFLPFAFSPDNASMLVRTRKGLQSFNLKTGVQEAFIQSPEDVIAAALSPDGQILAWSLGDNTIQLIQLSDQKVLHTLQGHTDMVTKLRFSPKGDFLVSASHDYWVKVWNLQGEELISFQAGALGIGISPDGSLLATVPFDGPVALWDLLTGEKIKDLGGSGGYDTSDAEFSRDGQYLAVDLASGIYIWRISDGALVWNEVKNSMAVSYSPDGQYLAYSDVDDSNKVILSAPDSGQTLRVIDKMKSPVWELFFSQDASLLAATDGLEIRVWQVKDGTLLYVGKAACP